MVPPQEMILLDLSPRVMSIKNKSTQISQTYVPLMGMSFVKLITLWNQQLSLNRQIWKFPSVLPRSETKYKKLSVVQYGMPSYDWLIVT